MNVKQALDTLQEYYDKDEKTRADEYRYTDALNCLIEQTAEPKYMCELAWYFCEHKEFDLELKYLEMAEECGYVPAMEELGYMWYYGQHGKRDYEKAFHYFSEGAESKDHGSLWCEYKLADMYRYGLYVDKDENKYCEMIKQAYEKVKNPRFLNDPFPEISLRLAGIKSEEGDKEEAVSLLMHAKRFMAERLSFDSFWGNIEVMGRIVRYMYTLKPIDVNDVDFYDLFYLTLKPGKFSLKPAGSGANIESLMHDGECVIKYNGRWYRDFDDFCQRAEYNGMKFTKIYDTFYDIEIN